MAEIEAHWELKVGATILCRCQTAFRGGVRLTVYVGNFQILAKQSLERAVESTLDFIKGLNALEVVRIHFSTGDIEALYELGRTVALPIVEAYQQSSATNLEFETDVALQSHLNLLKHEACKSSITDLILCGGSLWAPMTPDSKIALGLLLSLKNLVVVSSSNPTPLPPLFLDSLIDVKFAKALTLGFYAGSSDVGYARKLLILLKSNLSFTGIDIRMYSIGQQDKESVCLLMNTLSKDSGNSLKTFRLTTNNAQAMSTTFVAALSSAISRLSPKLLTVGLYLVLSPDMLDQLKPRLLSAMSNNTDELRLKTFYLVPRPQEDEDLTCQCYEFAARKIIHRCTLGKDPLAIAALPRALKTINTTWYAGLDEKKYSATLLFETLRHSKALQDRLLQSHGQEEPKSPPE